MQPLGKIAMQSLSPKHVTVILTQVEIYGDFEPKTLQIHLSLQWPQSPQESNCPADWWVNVQPIDKLTQLSFSS